jgi:hypothetical protein
MTGLRVVDGRGLMIDNPVSRVSSLRATVPGKPA